MLSFRETYRFRQTSGLMPSPQIQFGSKLASLADQIPGVDQGGVVHAKLLLWARTNVWGLSMRRGCVCCVVCLSLLLSSLGLQLIVREGHGGRCHPYHFTQGQIKWDPRKVDTKLEALQEAFLSRVPPALQ